MCVYLTEELFIVFMVINVILYRIYKLIKILKAILYRPVKLQALEVH